MVVQVQGEPWLPVVHLGLEGRPLSPEVRPWLPEKQVPFPQSARPSCPPRTDGFTSGATFQDGCRRDPPCLSPYTAHVRRDFTSTLHHSPRATSVTSSPASPVLTPPAGDGSDAGQREILGKTVSRLQGAVQPELRLPALRLLSVEVSIGPESELILVRGAATPTCTRTATGGTGWDTVSRPSSRSQLTRP